MKPIVKLPGILPRQDGFVIQIRTPKERFCPLIQILRVKTILQDRISIDISRCVYQFKRVPNDGDSILWRRLYTLAQASMARISPRSQHSWLKDLPSKTGLQRTVLGFYLHTRLASNSSSWENERQREFSIKNKEQFLQHEITIPKPWSRTNVSFILFYRLQGTIYPARRPLQRLAFVSYLAWIALSSLVL